MLDCILLKNETKSGNCIGDDSSVHGPIPSYICSEVPQLDERFVAEGEHIFRTVIIRRGTVSYVTSYIRLGTLF